MAPQTAGNGPDGALPLINRSPMAQERGTVWVKCVLATNWPLVFGFIYQGKYEVCGECLYVAVWCVQIWHNCLRKPSVHCTLYSLCMFVWNILHKKSLQRWQPQPEVQCFWVVCEAKAQGCFDWISSNLAHTFIWIGFDGQQLVQITVTVTS